MADAGAFYLQAKKTSAVRGRRRSWVTQERLQVEVALCVVEADAADDLLQSLLVVGILAVLDPLTDEVAEDAAEAW